MNKSIIKFFVKNEYKKRRGIYEGKKYMMYSKHKIDFIFFGNQIICLDKRSSVMNVYRNIDIFNLPKFIHNH